MRGTITSLALSLERTLGIAAAAGLLFASADADAKRVNVVTYHNDALRAGWNSGESSLSSSVVGGFTFGLLHQVEWTIRSMRSRSWSRE